MPPSADDVEARREELERWAQDQRRLHGGPAPVRRLPARGDRLYQLSLVVDRALDRLADRFLGRGFDTATYAVAPEHRHPDRTHYVPSAWHVLPRALRYLGVSADDTFIDFGCGKGRVVHQAARRPFRRVIGVEISPVLAEVARAGLAARRHQHRCPNVEIVVADVTQYSVPDDMTIGYLFRPFQNEFLDAVLEGVVDSMERHPRRVRLIYVWPTSGARSQILATGRFQLVKEQSSSLLNPRSFRVEIFESRAGAGPPAAC